VYISPVPDEIPRFARNDRGLCHTLGSDLKALREVLEIHLTRWKIEVSCRFLQSSYRLEDVLVRSYVGLPNMAALVMAAFYFFLAVVLQARFELSILMRIVLAKVRRFFEGPEFRFYALADGLFRILFRIGHRPPAKPPADKTPPLALSLWSHRHPGNPGETPAR